MNLTHVDKGSEIRLDCERLLPPEEHERAAVWIVSAAAAAWNDMGARFGRAPHRKDVIHSGKGVPEIGPALEAVLDGRERDAPQLGALLVLRFCDVRNEGRFVVRVGDFAADFELVDVEGGAVNLRASVLP